MFKAYHSNEFNAVLKDDLYQYNYWIVDDDFVELWGGPNKQRLNHSTVRCGAIIQCYESKGLNVAFNLALYHRWMDDNFEWYKLQDELRYNVEHTPMYVEYAPVVKQYLDRFNKLKVFW